MAEPRVPDAAAGQRRRKHRRIAYRVVLTRSFEHGDDDDMIDGVYRDQLGEVVGPLLVADHPRIMPDTFLVIPDEELPLVHVEAAFEGDHRIAEFDQVFALIYRDDETASRGVTASGDRWEGGDMFVYTFEDDDEALTAQQYAIGD